jgi:hypothetical protein
LEQAQISVHSVIVDLAFRAPCVSTTKAGEMRGEEMVLRAGRVAAHGGAGCAVGENPENCGS